MIRNIADAKKTLAEILRLKDGKEQIRKLSVQIAMCRDPEARKLLQAAQERILEIQSAGKRKPPGAKRPSGTQKPPKAPSPPSRKKVEKRPSPPEASEKQAMPRPPSAPTRKEPPPEKNAPSPPPRPRAKPKAKPPPRPPSRPGKDRRLKAETSSFEKEDQPAEENENDIPLLSADRILDDDFPFPLEDLDSFDVHPGPPPSPPPKRVKKPPAGIAATGRRTPPSGKDPTPPKAAPAKPPRKPPAKPAPAPPTPHGKAPAQAEKPGKPTPAKGKSPEKPPAKEDDDLLSIIRKEIESGETRVRDGKETPSTAPPSPGGPAPPSHAPKAAGGGREAGPFPSGRKAERGRTQFRPVPLPSKKPGKPRRPTPPPLPGVTRGPSRPEGEAAPEKKAEAESEILSHEKGRETELWISPEEKRETVVESKSPAEEAPSRPDAEEAAPSPAPDEEGERETVVESKPPAEEAASGEAAEEAPGGEARELEEMLFSPEGSRTISAFRRMFRAQYRNIPSWVVSRTYVEEPQKVKRLVEEAVEREAQGDDAGYRNRLSKLYEETLTVKIRHGRTGRKVAQFLESTARRAAWRLEGMPVDAGMVEEAQMAVMALAPRLERCRALMRGDGGSFEQAKAFLAEMVRKARGLFRTEDGTSEGRA